MSTTHALIAASAGAALEPGTIDRRDLRDDDVQIDVKFAGIVSAVGAGVTRYQVGDRVGVGCMVDSCGECEFCKDGEEQYCTKGAVMTYNGAGYDGEKTMGGYSQQVVVSERFTLGIPEGIELDAAAPLLCAGITTYSPLKRWGAGPGKKVAVIGMGGLGHMAVKIAAALGAEVTVLSRTLDKQDDAKRFGAAHHFATKDDATFTQNASAFDLIINTVSADLPMDAYMALLRPLGALVNVGLPSKPYEITPFSVVGGSRALAGSNIGGIAQTQEMLDFCAEHHLGAEIETIGADQVNEAYERVVSSDVRYRFVIDTATISA
jgi:uncharacterized zinc-type alcohol dehydrogenase-like protein